MEKAQQVLLDLIKVSQFGGDLSIDSVSWDEVYKEALDQSVLGIVASAVPADVKESDPRWMDAIHKQTASYIRYTYAETGLTKVMDEAGIPFVILKGNAAAVYYKEPSYRMMGDIDFQVLPEDFSRTRSLLLESGYTLENEKEEYIRHIAFSKDGVSFELHRQFSHKEVDIEPYIVDGIKNQDQGIISGRSFHMLPRLANGLVLLDHMRNHLLSGLGLRQVIDWMMYVNKELDDEFWNTEFGPIAKEKGMDTLAIAATRMCQIYLGLRSDITWCSSASEDICNAFIENLMQSGNFGRKSGQGHSIESVRTSMKRKGLFRWLQYAGEHNWKAYKKHHWLRPFCWLYQIFRYLRQGIQTGRSSKQIKSDLDRSQERYDLLKKLGIS